MSTVNKKHYYIKMSEYGEIINTMTSDFTGMPCDRIPEIKKACWEKNFKVYQETEQILEQAQNPDDFTWFPLYRWLGQDDEDYEFNTMEDALKEYESHLGDEIYCSINDC